MTLGVAVSADRREVKRRYRRLARHHHPDHGGDPADFDELRRAYERLVDDDAPPPVGTSPGRPSRSPDRFAHGPDDVDLGAVDWARTPPSTSARLDRDTLAVWLADADAGGIQALEATSRAPGSRLNRLAHLLSPELTSTVRIAVAADEGLGVVAVDVEGANRRARRALDTAPLHGRWVRTRRSTTTRLRHTLPAARDPRITAVLATDRLVALLDELAWPLESWRVPSPE